MVWWMRPPWRNSSHSRETNSTRWKFQIQYLFINTSPPSSIVRTSHTVSLWFSWNLNGVSRTFERWSKRSPLLPPSLVSPHYGPNKRGRNPPFFLFFPFSFFFLLLRGWICKGGEPPRLLTSFLTSAIHSRRRRGWLGKRFHLDAHLVEKIFHGIYYGGDVMSPFVPWKERWYLRNKRSRLNALLAIRAINGASTLISCLRYLHPPSPRQWWVSDINTGLDVFALIDFRLSLSPSIV